MSDAHAAGHEEHSTKPYLMVFIGLIILTFVTVGLSDLNLGYVGNKLAGIAVAVTKATLVISIFMHMKTDGAKDKYLLVAIFFPLALFCLIVASNFPDTVYRGGDQARHFIKGPFDKTNYELNEPIPTEHEHGASEHGGEGEHGK